VNREDIGMVDNNNLDNNNVPPEDLESSESFETEIAETAAGAGKKSIWLLVALGGIVVVLAGVSWLFYDYVRNPAPLPELVAPGADINYAPHYLFSIYGVDKPVGVALSPGGDRIYVTESGTDRMVRIFDRDGEALGEFTTPDTLPGERSPVYVATDASGRVYVTDRTQHAVFVYDPDGVLLDVILGPDLTLSEYVSKHSGDLLPGTQLSYNIFEEQVSYQQPEKQVETLPAPDVPGWSPLGINIGADGELLFTDVTEDHNCVHLLPEDVTRSTSWQEFSPQAKTVGATGQGNGQFLFPNSAVTDSQGQLYISDGNNGRISVWDPQGNFLFNFGTGTGDGALSLPRGMHIDERDRLYVVDAVAQKIVVYDISGEEISFLFAFGAFGMDDGLFNYPNDLTQDSSGRLYIADRENNRIQVWSY
jgi:sugar lactone lactonase YvrE